MTSSNGNIFRVTGLSCGESQRPVTRSFNVSLICAWIHGWVNNREAGVLRCHGGHYDVTIMSIYSCLSSGVEHELYWHLSNLTMVFKGSNSVFETLKNRNLRNVLIWKYPVKITDMLTSPCVCGEYDKAVNVLNPLSSTIDLQWDGYQPCINLISSFVFHCVISLLPNYLSVYFWDIDNKVQAWLGSILVAHDYSKWCVMACNIQRQTQTSMYIYTRIFSRCVWVSVRVSFMLSAPRFCVYFASYIYFYLYHSYSVIVQPRIASKGNVSYIAYFPLSWQYLH